MLNANHPTPAEVTMKKLIAWASLPLLPLVAVFALLWLYLMDDLDNPKSPPYSF